MAEQRRLAAIVAADIAGYSRLMGEDESGTLAALKERRRQVDRSAHRGAWRAHRQDDGRRPAARVSERGRGRALRDRDPRGHGAAERGRSPRLGSSRSGSACTSGDVIVDGDDIIGDGVNIAARLEAIAEIGGICLSQRAYEDVRDRLPVAFVDGGPQTLKNIARPVHVWHWTPAGRGGAGAAAAGARGGRRCRCRTGLRSRCCRSTT